MDKVKLLALALFAAGLCASFAFAGNGHGQGQGDGAASSTGAATSTDTSPEETPGGHGPQKVTLCHKAGPHGKWVRISVGKPAAKAHLRHGDVAPDASGACPAPPASP